MAFGQQERGRDRERRGGPIHGWLFGFAAGGLPSAQFIYAGSLSAFLNLSQGQWPGMVSIAMKWNGSFDTNAMWGPPGDPAWARNDPTLNVSRLVANNTHLGVLRQRQRHRHRPGPCEPGRSHRRTGILEGFAIDSNRAFKDAYLAAAVATARSTSPTESTAGATGASSCSR